MNKETYINHKLIDIPSESLVKYIIIGLDLSLNETGLCVLETISALTSVNESNPKKNKWKKFIKEDLIETQIIKTFPDIIIDHRLDSIVSHINDANLKYHPEIVIIEGLAFQGKGNSSAQLAGLHYLVRNYLIKNEVHFKIIPPTKLKKFVSGKGNAKKDLMLLNVYKKWGIDFDNHNLADAFGLAMMGIDIIQQDISQ